MISATVITVDSTIKTNVLEFNDYNFTAIFSDRCMTSFGTRKIDKMLTFLKLAGSVTACTPLVHI
jgi:hypothetical protein